MLYWGVRCSHTAAQLGVPAQQLAHKEKPQQHPCCIGQKRCNRGARQTVLLVHCAHAWKLQGQVTKNTKLCTFCAAAAALCWLNTWCCWLQPTGGVQPAVKMQNMHASTSLGHHSAGPPTLHSNLAASISTPARTSIILPYFKQQTWSALLPSPFHPRPLNALHLPQSESILDQRADKAATCMDKHKPSFRQENNPWLQGQPSMPAHARPVPPPQTSDLCLQLNCCCRPE